MHIIPILAQDGAEFGIRNEKSNSEAAPGYKTADQFKVFLAYYSGNVYKTQDFAEFNSAYNCGL